MREKLLGLRLGGNGMSGGADYRLSPEGKDHALVRAERIVSEGLVRHGLGEADLALLPGSHPAKVEIAVALWTETVVGQKWIARRLAMKSATGNPISKETTVDSSATRTESSASLRFTERNSWPSDDAPKLRIGRSMPVLPSGRRGIGEGLTAEGAEAAEG